MISYENRKKQIGCRIKTERERLKLKPQDFLQKIYKSPSSHKTLTAWENGERLPDLDSLALMADIFGCDIGYLLCDYDETTRDGADVANITGLSTAAINNLVTAKSISEIGKLFSWDGIIGISNIKEETPIGVISSLVGDKTVLRLLYHFFVAEDLDNSGIVKNTRSNAILIELIGELLNKRNYLTALRPKVENEGGTGDG